MREAKGRPLVRRPFLFGGHMAHAGGRPPLYDTPEQMQEAIDAYFDKLDGMPPTVTGLVLYLGFDHRSSLDYYIQEKPQFSGTIKAAKSRIEEFLEQTLYRQASVTGIIFNLKNNFGWKDEQKVEHSGGVRVVATDHDEKL